MIDRNDFDLRFAMHETRMAAVNALAWQRQVQESRQSVRAVIATALFTLAARLDSANLLMARNAGRVVENPAA